MTRNIQEEIEDKVIDCINSGVGGRLVIFKPEEKGWEDYLAVERRGKYKESALYFQVNSLAGPVGGDNFVRDFAQESFKAGADIYLLFVYFDEVRQKMADYVWLVPSLYFEDSAQVVKSPEGKKLFRFQAPFNLKNKNQYSNFVVKTDGLGDLISDALGNKGQIDFKKGAPGMLAGLPFEEKKAINLQSLKDFICLARENTYAANASPIDSPRLLASKQLEFQKGNYFYRDVFFGGEKNFVGQEIVYLDSKPIWTMNYIGSQVKLLEESFLKEALLKLSEKCRFGGVCEYEKREFRYKDQGAGSLEGFSGQEEIFSNNKSIYKLNYQGGLL